MSGKIISRFRKNDVVYCKRAFLISTLLEEAKPSFVLISHSIFMVLDFINYHKDSRCFRYNPGTICTVQEPCINCGELLKIMLSSGEIVNAILSVPTYDIKYL